MPTFIPSVSRTMAVFERFAHEGRELSNSEMARLLEIAESSCSDLLHTLQSLGYLARVSQSRRFYPTGKLAHVSARIAGSDPLLALAEEAVEQLTAATNETAYFGVLERGAVRVVAVRQSTHALRYVLEPGQRIAVHASGMGKAILGVLPPEERASTLAEHPLRALTPATITDPDALVADVVAAHERGWAMAAEEGAEGVTVLAVAGLLHGTPVALSLGGPSGRISRTQDDLVTALRAAGSRCWDTARADSPAAL